MKLHFTKMHGCGNDYVYIDCFSHLPQDPAALAVRLSDRHKSIGGDGIILVCPSQTADAKMRMFNRDGSEGKMCGNGVRCVAEYLFTHGMAEGKTAVDIETLAGTKHIVRRAPGLLTVDMGAAEFAPGEVPVTGFDTPVIDRLAEVGGEGVRITCVSMGNPHCVVRALCGPPDVSRGREHRVCAGAGQNAPCDARVGARQRRDNGLRNGGLRFGGRGVCVRPLRKGRRGGGAAFGRHAAHLLHRRNGADDGRGRHRV